MGANRGPANQGPGILGAKPGDRLIPDIPPANLHLPGLLWVTCAFMYQWLCCTCLSLLNEAISLPLPVSLASSCPLYASVYTICRVPCSW